MNFSIEIRLEESYMDRVNETLTVEFYKQWKDKWGVYERLLASIPGIPFYQAKALANAANKAIPTSIDNTVIPFRKLQLVEE